MQVFEFGQRIPQLTINGEEAPYAVVNERVARASAGILLSGAAIAFAEALLANNRAFLRTFIVAFLVEFAIRVLVNPRLAPVYALGGFLVGNQTPEWVGAIQKRFAWSLGLTMATVMVFLTFAMDYAGIWTRVICIICLLLLWLETACGICVGCKIFHGLIRIGAIPKPEVAPACPGNVCSIDPRPKAK